MCKKCEKCGKQESPFARIEYDDEMDMFACGQCWRDFNDSIEEYEESRRERIAIENEY